MRIVEETSGVRVDRSLLSAYATTVVTDPDGRTRSGSAAIEELPYGDLWLTVHEHLVVHAGSERTVGARPRVTSERDAMSVTPWA